MNFSKRQSLAWAWARRYALLGLGFTLIFEHSRVVDSPRRVLHGRRLCGVQLRQRLGLPYPLAVLASMIVTGAVGWVFELFTIGPLVDDHLATLMLTLALYLIMSTGVLTGLRPDLHAFTFPVTGAIQVGPVYVPRENPDRAGSLPCRHPGPVAGSVPYRSRPRLARAGR